MIPVKAPIQQNHFIVLQSSLDHYLGKKNPQIDSSKNPIEIDYDLYFHDEFGRHVFRIIMTVKGNSKKSVNGYVFSIKVGAEYTLSEEIEVDSEQYWTYIRNTGVACLLNEVRIYLQSLTAFSVFGPYLLPMIDMNDLSRQKSELAHSEEAKISQ